MNRELMAERVGFEPTCPLLAGKTLSRRPRYNHFGTSPQKSGHDLCDRLIYIARSSRLFSSSGPVCFSPFAEELPKNGCAVWLENPAVEHDMVVQVSVVQDRKN